MPICDLISFAPCGETFLLILILPQPFQRVCSIGVLADVLLDVLAESLSFAASKALLSASLMATAVEVEFLPKRDLILLIGTYLSIYYTVKLYINRTRSHARSLLSCSHFTRLPCIQIILNRLSLLFRVRFRSGFHNQEQFNDSLTVITSLS